jgi:DNA-binding NarL/FixJ family response regulator
VNRTVLADREADQRHLLRLALTRDPAFEIVAEAADGPTAVSLVQRCDADLLLLDVDLPRLDGIEVVSQVRTSRPSCTCVLVSSLPASELRSASIGTVGVVARSTPATALASEVRALAAAVDAAHDAGRKAATLRVGPDTSAPRVARRFVNDVLTGSGYGEVLDVVELLVTEVVTNAVVHARSEADVVVRLLPHAVRVEVHDGDDSFPVRRAAGHDQPGGRGLDLIEQMSRSWGIDMLDVGKRIWFEVATRS